MKLLQNLIRGLLALYIIVMSSVACNVAPTVDKSTLAIEESNITKDGESSTTSNTQTDSSSTATTCEDSNNLLTHAPLENGAIHQIMPLGHVGGAGHVLPTGHTYMALADKTVENPVYAPANIVITQVRVRTNNDDSFTIGVFFSVCDEVSGHFGHVSELSEDILNQLPDWDTCENSECVASNTEIQVTAGSIIGYAGGDLHDGASSVDFGLRDERLEQPFYYRSELPHNLSSVCPFDYFSDSDLRDFYYDKLNDASDITPECGLAMADEEDSLQGAWVLDGVTKGISDEDLLGLVPSNIFASQNTIAIGTGEWAGQGLYIYEIENSGKINRAFTDIKDDGNQYCFDNLKSHPHVLGSDLDGYIMIKQTDSETILIDRVTTGDCPADPNSYTMSGDALTYVR